MKRYILLILLIYLSSIANTQLNPIFLTIPFLLDDINSKTGGMGETGVVSTGNSYFSGPYQNPSLLVNTNKTAGLYTSCLPQLFQERQDEWAINILSYYKWNEKNVIGASYTYFNFGRILFLDSLLNVIGSFQPYDHYINLHYAHSFNKNLSAGTVVKYIHNDICGGNSRCGEEYHPGRTFAVDLGLDFKNELNLSENLTLSYDLGAALENLGPRVSYTEGTNKYFLPANLAIGSMVSFSFNINEKTNLISSIAYQAEKLLVPTPPEYYIDSVNTEGEKVILAGRKVPSSLPLSWVQSFYDAPGGFKEEWHEILHKFGIEACIEYTENFKFALRCGRHYEHWTKGARTYNTLGAGFYIYGFTLDAKLISGHPYLHGQYGLTAGLQLDL